MLDIPIGDLPANVLLKALHAPQIVCVASATTPTPQEAWSVDLGSTSMLLAAHAGWTGDVPILPDRAVSSDEAVRLKLVVTTPAWTPGAKR